MKIIPFRDELLVKRKQRENKIGSLYVADAIDSRGEQKKSYLATVLASGPEAKSKQGDTVIIGMYAGEQVTISHHSYLMVSEEKVLGLIEYEGFAPIEICGSTVSSEEQWNNLVDRRVAEKGMDREETVGLLMAMDGVREHFSVHGVELS